MMMKTLSTAVLFGSLACAQFAPPASVSNVSSSDCPTSGGAHIIVARASLEAPGYGIIGSVKDAVLKRVPGSTAEFVTYPATLDDYFNSESDGVLAMKKLINAYTDKCSASLPLVLMGYSQGAQVSADSLAGQQVAAFPDNSSINQPLPASTLSRVAAVVIMGDPSFVTNETFHVGNATRNGLFPRKDVSNFNTAGLSAKVQSYCDFNDPYCASGNLSTGLPVHLGYVQEYGSQAEDFVVNQIKAFYSNGTSTSSNGTSSSGSGSSTSSNGTSSGGSGSSTTSSTPAAYTGAASTMSAVGKIAPIAVLAGVIALAM